MKIEWREHLSVGVEEIDVQHRSLFEKFNAFTEACDLEKGEAEVARLFGFLDRDVNTHFADEERLQLRLCYPEYEKHREQHRKFRADLADLKERLSKEGTTRFFVSSVSRVMIGWLIEHISGMDRAFGRFTRERGSVPA